MEIFNEKIGNLIPYEFNNKVHDEIQVNRIANSIKEFWFTQPIVIDKNNIVVIWHWRLEAAKKLWLKEVPCVRMSELNDKQIKKLRILDNKLNESEWNKENLKIDLDDLWDLKFWDIEIDFSELIWDVEDEPLEEKNKVGRWEVEFTEQLGEENNYLVLFFDNSVDWINAQSIFNLKPVKALDSKEWYERVWVGRVINGTDFINKLLEAYKK